MDSLVHPCTSVVMYRSDFKHTLSCSVDSFGMYMYDGFLKLWIYNTYIYIELYKMFHVKHSFIYIIYDLINKDVLVY